MVFSIKRIKKQDEMKQYIDFADRYIGVRFPLEYFQGAHVYALFVDGKMVGGYAIVVEGSFRILESLKDKDVGPIETKGLAEITGLWLNQRHARKFSVCLWSHMIYGILKSRKSAFIFSYTLSSESLEKLYSVIPTKVIYRGKIEALEGMKYDDFESIEIVKKWDALLLPVSNPKFLLKRSKGLLGGVLPAVRNRLKESLLESIPFKYEDIEYAMSFADVTKIVRWKKS